ncbi:MAG: phosphatidate cytidylyltransferase, partial [Planctomycetota bacterium]
GKTIEGAIGGLAGSIAVGCALKPFMGSAGESLNWGWTVVFAAACSIACQLGDLIESRLKRRAGVKDSGELVPEFGGFLDIVDGLIFAAPVGYAILRLAGGGHH